ncbi:MAG: tetratricopeptide repeat protein, partial [Candidatus Binatia bacterium]
PMTDERITNLEAATKDLEERPGWRAPSWELERVQAILHALTEDRAGARSRYERAGGARGRALLGIVVLHQGDYPAAIDLLERARKEGQEGLEGDLGLARLRSGDVDEAIVLLRSRIEIAPDDVVARANLGAALLSKGDYAGARNELRAALDAAPWLDEAEFNLGQSYGKGGDGARGVFHLARAFELRGEVERALSQYEKAEKLLPEGSAESEEAKRRVEMLRQVVTERVLGRQRSR